jgi:Spy/CpxP family protein refolding chaperone
MKRLTTLIALIFTLAPFAAFAQQDRPMMPKGRWWRMPDVSKQLRLTPEQQEKLDAAFTQRSKELIDLKAEMEKSAIELRASLESYDSNDADVMKFANAVGDARSKLFRKEIEMMLDIRSELTEEQWTRLRTAID